MSNYFIYRHIKFDSPLFKFLLNFQIPSSFFDVIMLSSTRHKNVLSVECTLTCHSQIAQQMQQSRRDLFRGSSLSALGSPVESGRKSLPRGKLFCHHIYLVWDHHLKMDQSLTWINELMVNFSEQLLAKEKLSIKKLTGACKV